MPLHPYAITIDACPATAAAFTRCVDEAHGFAAVRCCGTEAGVCGASICARKLGGLPPRTGLNPRNASYAEAAIECRAHNMRLCEAYELRSCCSAACGFDDLTVWSHTLCSPPAPGSADAGVVPAVFLLATIGALVALARDGWKRCVRGSEPPASRAASCAPPASPNPPFERGSERPLQSPLHRFATVSSVLRLSDSGPL